MIAQPSSRKNHNSFSSVFALLSIQSLLPSAAAVNYREPMESLNGRQNGETGNCPAQSPVTNEGSSPLGCMWVPLSARIVSLMFRGLFIYLGYISFFKHSAVRFIIELCVCMHTHGCPPWSVFRVVWLWQLPPQRCGGTGHCSAVGAVLGITNSWRVCVNKTLCLKVRFA